MTLKECALCEARLLALVRDIRSSPQCAPLPGPQKEPRIPFIVPAGDKKKAI